MRRPILAGNWKLNKTIREAVETVTLLMRRLSDVTAADIVVCPPFTAIASVADALSSSNIAVGSQDVYWEEKGAFTGEVAPSMLKEAGAAYAIIGHSERRQFFHETHETVNKKTKAVLAAGLVPIVCVGELLAEREAGKTFQVLEEQVKGAFAGFPPKGAADPPLAGATWSISDIVLAYEPVWAIGTGKVATPAQAQEAHAFIRGQVKTLFGNQAAERIRIQYGGSVKSDNIASLMQEADIDGALVGGASLDAASFADLVKNALAASVQH